MGKGVGPETHPQFIGVYSGALSDEYLKRRVEEADCLLCIGVQFNDFTSGGFTQHLRADKVIALHPDRARFKQSIYPQLAMADVLTQLASRGTARPADELDIRALHDRSRLNGGPIPKAASEPIRQQWFWQRLGQLLQPGDVLLADLGTAFAGAMLIPLPPRATFISQPLWASIGYTLPALLGTTLAAPDRRHILVIGDGALQMTVQELSTLLAHERHAVVLLLNNDGYVVMATGLYQKPKIPPFGANLPAAILQLHSGAYRNPGALPPGAVLVVGSGQSGAQIAEELYQSGRSVFLSIGRAGRMPRRYRGTDTHEWSLLTGLLDRTVDKLPSPRAKFASHPHLSGKNGGHTINLHQFVRDGVTLL